MSAHHGCAFLAQRQGSLPASDTKKNKNQLNINWLIFGTSLALLPPTIQKEHDINLKGNMMTKTPVCLLLLGALAASSPAMAALDGNIGVSSNYLWRGISQTGDAVALDGGIDYGHDSGFYAGFWASNVDFGDDTTFELDLYGGYSGQITESISFDVGYLYYGYPDADADIDFGELSASLSWEWLTLGYARVIHGGNDLAPDGLSDDDMDYLSAEVSIPLSDSLSLDFHYGYSSGDVVSSWYDESSYSDYSAAMTKSTDLGDVSFIVSDTDLDGDDPKVALRWAYSFGL